VTASIDKYQSLLMSLEKRRDRDKRLCHILELECQELSNRDSDFSDLLARHAASQCLSIAIEASRRNTRGMHMAILIRTATLRARISRDTAAINRLARDRLKRHQNTERRNQERALTETFARGMHKGGSS
jgi:hypothetical protein